MQRAHMLLFAISRRWCVLSSLGGIGAFMKASGTLMWFRRRARAAEWDSLLMSCPP
jgi:hypothetical protein